MWWLLLSIVALSSNLPQLSIATPTAYTDKGSKNEDRLVVVRRNMVYPDRLWKDGVVPYVISSWYDEDDKELVLRAMREIEDKVNKPGEDTCIQFVPWTDQEDYVYMEKYRPSCQSYIGRVDRWTSQDINIGFDCKNLGVVMHELTHALGFYHEHTRPDRDEYIEVNWDNIWSGFSHNFDKKPHSQTFNTSYDYGSIMHYGLNLFSRNGEPTITLKKPLPHGVVVGQRDGYSEGDVTKVRRLYGCEKVNLTCSFALSSACRLENVKSDDFDWQLKNTTLAVTPSGERKGQANLKTTITTGGTRQLCIKCLVYIKGKKSRFNVKVKNDKGEEIEKWSFYTNDINDKAETVSAPAEVLAYSNVTVVFVGKPRGKSGLIRLDDVQIHEGSCE